MVDGVELPVVARRYWHVVTLAAGDALVVEVGQGRGPAGVDLLNYLC